MIVLKRRIIFILKKRMLFIAVLMLCLGVLSGCSAASDNEDLAAETKTIVDAFVAAFNAGDGDACIALLSREIVLELKSGAQDVQSQDEKSVHDSIKANIGLNHKWQILDYLNSSSKAVTLKVSESGDDLTLIGVDSLVSQISFSVEDGKITRISTVIDKEQADRMSAATKGVIGIVSELLTDRVVITKVAPGSPAEKGGLLAADEIMAIDGMNCSDMKTGEQLIRIRGSLDTKVMLTISRPSSGETFDVEILRVDPATLTAE